MSVYKILICYDVSLIRRWGNWQKASPSFQEISFLCNWRFWKWIWFALIYTRINSYIGNWAWPEITGTAGNSRNIMTAVEDLDGQGQNTIFFPAGIEPEVAWRPCKQMWHQPCLDLVLRPRESNTIQNHIVNPCDYILDHKCFTETVIARPVLIGITKTGQLVSNKHLTGQRVFCLFCYYRWVKGEKMQEVEVKIPWAKSKLEQIHIKYSNVPKVSTCKSSLLDT